jgi:hypothetical protein
VVKVAIPQRRGRALPMNAMRFGWVMCVREASKAAANAACHRL